MIYEDRYFAFVDVLGFSNLVKQSAKGTIPVETIRNILALVHQGSPGDGTIIFGSDLKHQSVSDAIAISSAMNSNGLQHIVHALWWLSSSLLKQGYFVRGALVKGLLCQDSSVVFGPALLDAYNLESQVANYPRIIVKRDVIGDAKAIRDLDGYLMRSQDGPYIINPVQEIRADANNERQAHLIPELESTATVIQKRLNEEADNPRHYLKVKWMAQLWNGSLPSWAPDTAKIKGWDLGPGIRWNNAPARIIQFNR